VSVRARHLIPLLTACSAIGSVGNYLFLPALPQIGEFYGVDAGATQLTVTTYLIAFAVGVLISGPLADRFGRRPILIGGVALSGVAALLCYFVPTMRLLAGDPRRQYGLAQLRGVVARIARRHRAAGVRWIRA
jgi:MFS family permease